MITELITSDGRTVRVSDRGSGPAVVVLHGGDAGRSPYAASLDVWNPLTEMLGGHRVIALDRPGFGGSPATSAADLTYAAAERVVLDVVRQLGIDAFHVVGHGEGGLLALQITRNPAVRVLSCAVLAGTEAAPTGDSALNLRLANPPRPSSSRAAQAWALERLSYTPHHIGELLDIALAHAAAPAVAADLLDDAALHSDLLSAKDALFGYARDTGYSVPISLVWSSDDPLSPVERGVALLNLLASTTAELSLQVVNRVGHFPFRERPDEVARLLLPFFARHGSA
ncbi:alpha/beta fold hydrolase [Micromonospora sp. MA102]|uniref:alpha/beta fold hydrolase n=1 Tax=Micromonospora sp. MA102 TaxID=2952755 RepID=UPI0021C627C1|nr:alpha/beta hydrolase [Micromonospora sp. MA102]